MSDVLVALEGPTLWLTINRPEKRNALSSSVAANLISAISSAGPEVRAVVIAGAHPVFCAGVDIAALREVANHGAGEVTDVVYGHFHALLNSIRSAPVPVIAAVSGAARAPDWISRSPVISGGPRTTRPSPVRG